MPVAPSPLHRVLCVDDDPLIRTLVEACLRLGCALDVRVAASGPEALEILADWIPDLILLDVLMPGMDGPQTLAALRRLPGLADLPVAFLTGSNRAVDGDRYIEMGAIGSLGKPLNPRTLGGAVLTLWEQRPYWQVRAAL